MQILRKTNIDFLGKRPIAFSLSAIMMALCIWSLAGGINRGIDFTGGTEIQVKFAGEMAIDVLRTGLSERGIDAQLQRIGAPEDNEFLIRVGAEQPPGVVNAQEDPAPAPDPVAAGEPAAGRPAESARVYEQVLAALRQLTGASGEGRLDLNVSDQKEIATLLAGGPGGGTGAASLAEAVVAFRTSHAGLLRSYEDLGQVEGMTPEMAVFLRIESFLGPFTIRKVDFVGPRVGKELAEKAYLAMVFALAGMLVYITVRFKNLGYALGGIAALIHDGVISAGVFNLWGGQFDLTIVAALLTLLGYSINDTIVIFDRVRENTMSMRGINPVQVFNDSINQTLSRTLLTSLTTLLVVLCLYLFGGETIHGFAFLVLIGILVGTYSTIFIASPVAILYQRWTGRRRPGARVRSSTAGGPSSRRSAAS